MAKGINKVILLGHTTDAPAIKYMPSGDAVANLTIATNEAWKDRTTGQNKEKAEFHRVVIFGKLAEIAGQYLRKGSLVYIEGQIQTRKWQDQSGQDRYSTEIVVKPIGGTMQMLDRKGDDQNTQDDYQQNQAQQSNQAPQGFDDFSDDIHF